MKKSKKFKIYFFVFAVIFIIVTLVSRLGFGSFYSSPMYVIAKINSSDETSSAAQYFLEIDGARVYFSGKDSCAVLDRSEGSRKKMKISLFNISDEVIFKHEVKYGYYFIRISVDDTRKINKVEFNSIDLSDEKTMYGC